MTPAGYPPGVMRKKVKKKGFWRFSVSERDFFFKKIIFVYWVFSGYICVCSNLCVKSINEFGDGHSLQVVCNVDWYIKESTNDLQTSYVPSFK